MGFGERRRDDVYLDREEEEEEEESACHDDNYNDNEDNVERGHASFDETSTFTATNGHPSSSMRTDPSSLRRSLREEEVTFDDLVTGMVITTSVDAIMT